MKPFAAVAEVMRDRQVGVPWFHHLKVSVTEVEVCQPNCWFGQFLAVTHRKAEPANEVLERSLRISHQHGHVMETLDVVHVGNFLSGG